MDIESIMNEVNKLYYINFIVFEVPEQNGLSGSGRNKIKQSSKNNCFRVNDFNNSYWVL